MGIPLWFGQRSDRKMFYRGKHFDHWAQGGRNPGLLKREFMEHLYKLPAWKKTKYLNLAPKCEK